MANSKALPAAIEGAFLLIQTCISVWNYLNWIAETFMHDIRLKREGNPWQSECTCFDLCTSLTSEEMRFTSSGIGMIGNQLIIESYFLTTEDSSAYFSL